MKYLKLLWIICIVSNSFAQAPSVERDIQDLMDQYQAVGVSVAVVKNSKIVYSHAFGLKNIEKQHLLEKMDIFRIASISKSFSATAIMQLVEAKKLSLDDDFGKLIGFTVRNPNFPDQVITLRMVLSHTSSINDSQGYFNLDVINPSKNPDYAKCYNKYAPGNGYQYCNLNFNMVGGVIERFSGERFDQYIKKHILSPLNIKNAGYNVDSLNASTFTTLYEYDGATKKFNPSDAYISRSKEIENYTLGYSTPIFSPTGGMKISAIDLATYMTMHMNYGKYKGGRLITEKNSKIMQTKLSDEEGYGLALLNTDKIIEGKFLVGHTGSAYGLYSSMFFSPKEKFGIVVITNGSIATYKDGFVEFTTKVVNTLYDQIVK